MKPTLITNHMRARMRALRAAGHTIGDIAGLVGVSPSTARNHTLGVSLPPGWQRPRQGRTNTVAVMKALSAGVPVRFIADRYGVTPNAIWQVKRRALRKNRPGITIRIITEALGAAE